MHDERISRAKRAELEALVNEHGTQGERFSLALNGFRRAGGTLSALHRADAGDETVRTGPPDPQLLAQTVARIELRRRLGVEQTDCVKDEACTCLRDALDLSPTAKTKGTVTRKARKLHAQRNPIFKPLPIPPIESEPRMAPTTRPAPIPEAVTQTNTKKFRVIRKTKRWYDDRGGGGIRDTTF
jgi:hypothetical protein